MFAYASDHHEAYPTGQSSTEVFQKLIDEKYASDPTVFYYKLLGKTKPTSNKLKPENISWDVTTPVDDNDSDDLPVVFLTGYRLYYLPGGSAVPLFKPSEDRPSGCGVAYHGSNAWFQKNNAPDGTITHHTHARGPAT